MPTRERHAAAALPFGALSLVGVLLAWLGPIVCLVLLWRSRSSSRSRVPKPTAELAHNKWSAAAIIRKFLLAGREPRAVPVWDVVPQSGEVFWLAGEAAYSRFYGHDVSFTPAHGVVVGRPRTVIAGLAVAVFSNASARRKAAGGGVAQWRERQRSRVVVSNRRVICRANDQWLSFWYSDVTSVDPQLEQWSLSFEFGTTQPLLLDGLDVPTIAVLVISTLYGTAALESHPGLACLRSA